MVNKKLTFLKYICMLYFLYFNSYHHDETERSGDIR